MLLDVESRLREWEPALGYPGRADAAAAAPEPTATRSFDGNLFYVHREAARTLLPHDTSVNSAACHWAHVQKLRMLASVLFHGQVLLMETDFETHDPVVGSYPRRCDEDYYRALREAYAVLDRHAPPAVRACVV